MEEQENIAEEKAAEKEEEEKTIAEKRVENFLNELGLKNIYESPIFIEDDKKRPRLWSPDFFLPELGIYIEVCGAQRRAYKYRRQIYEANKIPVIFVKTFYSEKSWKEYILKGIRRIHQERCDLITKKGLFYKLSSD
ncbi:hypothetical protein JXB28_00045 [Candidatus Woesearchaeota archaeon]|nr:hypothetical protein [Candidatus Woesearchaeota archaeon]